MSAPFLPERRATIEGVECFIVADAIATGAPVEGMVLLDDGSQSWRILCSLAHLSAVRGSHRGLPLYGFWQVLEASGVWHPSTPLQAYQDENGNGQFVFSDDAQIVTGEVVHGKLVSTPVAKVEDEQPQWLDLAAVGERLKLPRRQAETSAERLERIHAAATRKWTRAGMVAAAAALSFFAAEQLGQFVEAGRGEELARLQHEARALQAARSRAAGGRLQRLPDQSARLDQLLRLTLLDPELRVERSLARGLNGALTVRIRRQAYENFLAETIKDARYLQTGGVELPLPRPVPAQPVSPRS